MTAACFMSAERSWKRRNALRLRVEAVRTSRLAPPDRHASSKARTAQGGQVLQVNAEGARQVQLAQRRSCRDVAEGVAAQPRQAQAKPLKHCSTATAPPRGDTGMR